MGKRRLRFDQRKNHERLKYAPKSLTVSVPHSISVMAFRESLPLRYSSLYTTSPATDIATLHARIVTCQVLSPGWTILLHPQSLTLCQLCCKPPHTDTVVSFSVTISSDFSWSLTLYGHTIEVVGTNCCMVFLSSEHMVLSQQYCTARARSRNSSSLTSLC